MSRDYEPQAGQWYEDLDNEEAFQVLSVDPDEEIIRIQWPDREIREIDLDQWNEMDVEHEELGFRAEEHLVADTQRSGIGLGLLGDRARVAVVGLARHRVDDVAEDDDEDEDDDLEDEDEDDEDDDWDDDEDDDLDEDDDEYRDRE